MKMYTSIALLAPLLSFAVASPHPEVTLAARLPIYHEDKLNLLELQRRAADLNKDLSKRQKVGDLGYCFGRNSICEQSNDLASDCRQSDYEEYAKCRCGNGYVAVRQACGWCQDAWGISQIDIQSINTAMCTSYSLPIAPVPKSILQLQSSYNATWTGTLLGTKTLADVLAGGSGGSSAAQTTSTSRGFGGGIGQPIGGGTSTSEEETTTTTSSTRSSETDAQFTGPTSTFDGGGAIPTVTRTVIGNANGGEATPASTSASGGNSGGGSGAAVGLKMEARVFVSAFVFALAGLCLL